MKIELFLIFAITVIGSAFMGYEFGYVEGQQYQKFVNNEKLQSCNKLIAGSIYEQ